MTDAERLLQQTERVMAVFYLEATKRISELVPDPDDDANRFWVIANVFELAVQHRHLPIGHCDNCYSRSPLVPGEHEGREAMVCVWGCE